MNMSPLKVGQEFLVTIKRIGYQWRRYRLL